MCIASCIVISGHNFLSISVYPDPWCFEPSSGTRSLRPLKRAYGALLRNRKSYLHVDVAILTPLSFDITPDIIDWVSNLEKTRWFLVLRVKRPKNGDLNRLLGISNRSLARFDQPPLYENVTHLLSKEPEDYSHCFHISLAWTLSEPSPCAKERTARIDLRRLTELSIHFNSVKAKIGNNVTSIPLSAGIQEERTIGGL